MYTECAYCNKIGVSCDGPLFVDMSASELLDWCRKRKAHVGISNAKIAECSGIPKGTVDRLFSMDNADFRWETIHPILKVLLGAELHGPACRTIWEPDGAVVSDLRQKNEAIENRLAGMRRDYWEQLKAIQHTGVDRERILWAQVRTLRRVILALSIAFATILVALVVSLVVHVYVY